MSNTRIYSFDFELLYITPRCSSAVGYIYYNDIGTFEGHFPLNDRICEIVLNNKFLVIEQYPFVGIITGCSADDDFVIYARTVNWLLSKRITPLFDGKTGDVKSLCDGFVTEAFYDVENLIVDSRNPFTNQIDFWRNTYTPTFEVVKGCLEDDGGGHELIFDRKNKQWIFRCYKGSEIIKIVSEANKNAYDTKIETDILDMVDGGYYQQAIKVISDWDASTNTPTLTDENPLNFEKCYRVSVAGTRFDISFEANEYIICDDISGKWKKSTEVPPSVWRKLDIEPEYSGMKHWETTLSGDSASDAKYDLKQKNKNYEVSLISTLEYKKDYNLGDIIRVQVVKGSYKKTSKMRITGVNFYSDTTKIGTKPILTQI